MAKPAEIVLKKCLCLKKNEKCLIVTDSKLFTIGKLFLKEAKKFTDDAKLLKIPIPKVSGTEPSNKIAEEMLKYDVELLITTRSLSHTKARKNACKKGARIVSMPTITQEVMERALNIDYGKLKARNKKLVKILTKGKKVKITTKKGTDLVMNIQGRKGSDDNGVHDRKGSFGNLPAGEVGLAPLEGTANGVYVIDASFASVGKLKTPLKINVKKGYAIKIKGKNAKNLVSLLDTFDKRARNIAEFSIGTNPKAKVSGCVLEDEKVIGTCHIALGNNTSDGGKVNVPIHLDGIIKKPTIWIDNRKIMDKGIFLI